MGWFKNLFKKKTIVGYRVYKVTKGQEDRLVVEHHVPNAEVALNLAQMQLITEHFKGGSAEPMFANLRADPVYERNN